MGDNPRKRAPNARNSKARNILDLGGGCRGLVITGGMTKCVREVLHNLLSMHRLAGDELADVSVAKDPAEPPPAKKLKLEDEIAAEAKTSSSKMEVMRAKYPNFDIPCGKNLQFIKFTEGVPSKMIRDMCALANEQHTARVESKATEGGEKVQVDITFRNGAKLVPMDIMCHPQMEAFKKNVRELIAIVFPNSKAAAELKATETGIERLAILKNTLGDDYAVAEEGTPWCVAFQKRSGMATIKRPEAIDFVADLVSGGEGHYPVNLTAPTLSLIIEVNPVFCGMSIVSQFKELKEFNLYRICHPEYEQNLVKLNEKSLKAVEEADAAVVETVVETVAETVAQEVETEVEVQAD